MFRIRLEAVWGILLPIAVMLAQLAGSLSVESCDMLTHGGILACACLTAVLRMVAFADRVAGMIASWVLTIVGTIARMLSLNAAIEQCRKRAIVQIKAALKLTTNVVPST